MHKKTGTRKGAGKFQCKRAEMPFRTFRSSLNEPVTCNPCGLGLLLDRRINNPAHVKSAVRTNTVSRNPSAAGRAMGQLNRRQPMVTTSLAGARIRMFSFWNCHRCLLSTLLNPTTCETGTVSLPDENRNLFRTAHPYKRPPSIPTARWKAPEFTQNNRPTQAPH